MFTAFRAVQLAIAPAHSVEKKMNLAQKDKALDRDQFAELTPADFAGPSAAPQLFSLLPARCPAARPQHAALARGNRGGGIGGAAAPAGL